MPTSPPAPGLLSPEGRWRPHLEALLIGLLALTLNLTGNGRISLWDRDEPRYATCVREMRSRHDWIYPTFNGEPRFHKPVFIYWVMRAGYAIGGDNPFGARLMSSLAGAATCLATWGLGRRLLGARAGLLAGLVLATAPIVVVESKLATTDATLALLFVVCQACLWQLAKAPSRGWAALFWVATALAILTKGPVIPVFLAASGLVAWFWGGPTSCWRRLGWRWGVPLALAIMLPWFIAIGVITRGEFYAVAVGFHIVQRVTTGIEEHGGFPGYYVLFSAATFYPWSALAPAALFGAWRRRREDPRFGFLLGWAVGPLLVLELIRTKLIHYYLPAYPACALLVSWLVLAVVGEGVNLRRFPLGRLSAGLLAAIGVGMLVGLVGAGAVAPAGVRWPCLVMATLLAAGTLWALGRLLRGDTERAVLGLAGTWAVLLLVVGGWLVPALEPYRPAQAVANRLAVLSSETKAAPVLLSFQEPSVIYAFGRPIPTIRTWDQLFALIDRHGAVVTAVLPHEIKEIEARPSLEAIRFEDYSGFNLTKGKTQKLHFVALRSRGGKALARGAGTEIR